MATVNAEKLAQAPEFYIRYLQRAIENKSVPTLDGGFVGERAEETLAQLARAVNGGGKQSTQAHQRISLNGVLARIGRALTARLRVSALFKNRAAHARPRPE